MLFLRIGTMEHYGWSDSKKKMKNVQSKIYIAVIMPKEVASMIEKDWKQLTI